MKKSILLLSTLMLAAISANLPAKHKITFKNETESKPIEVYVEQADKPTWVSIKKDKKIAIKEERRSGFFKSVSEAEKPSEEELGIIKWKGEKKTCEANVKYDKEEINKVIIKPDTYQIYDKVGAHIKIEDPQVTCRAEKEELEILKEIQKGEIKKDVVSAIEDGDLGLLKQLVIDGFDINSDIFVHGKPLVYKGFGEKVTMKPLHLAVIQALLGKKPLLPEEDKNFPQYIEIIKYLINEGADLQAKDREGNTPCYYLIEWLYPFVEFKIKTNRPKILNAIPELKDKCAPKRRVITMD
ncbi:hypothetical protein ACFLYA_02810 [Candidatus Dependentiae bacterium]